ncbi:hypothetical protein AwDysgo_09970 [Bacteroidales bacterium]|nr:hypothetical protein AwDysgo_09970 [Bacteroidales bacterium]
MPMYEVDNGTYEEILVSDMSLALGDTFYLNDQTLLANIKYDDNKRPFTIVDSIYTVDNRKHIRTQVHFWTKNVPLVFIEGLGPNYSIDAMTGENLFSLLTCYATEREFWKNMLYWSTNEVPETPEKCYQVFVGIPETKSQPPLSFVL